jgi:hypothetical protein
MACAVTTFIFTLLVIACDNEQHVLGHMGSSVVGCCNLRLSVEMFTTVAAWHIVIRTGQCMKQNICRYEGPSGLVCCLNHVGGCELYVTAAAYCGGEAKNIG